MEPTLITGATGFLGTHLVESLRASGTELRILSRAATRWEGVRGIETVRGDVTNAREVMRAADGVGAIYHLAGFVSRRPEDAPQLYRTHIEGTRNVCEAARVLGGRKVVFVSSSGTIAVGHEPVVYREGSSYKNDVVRDWPYYLAKIFAEKLALSYCRTYGLPIVVVNPSLLLGPGDERCSSTGDVALFLRGQIMAVPPGGLNFVDARDVAQGLALAMQRGAPGERYLLGGENWTFEKLIGEVARLSGRRAPKLKLSPRVSLLSARLLRAGYSVVGKSFDLDDESIKMSELFWYCDSSKAGLELGFRTRDPIETLKDTLQDLRRRVLHRCKHSPAACFRQ